MRAGKGKEGASGWWEQGGSRVRGGDRCSGRALAFTASPPPPPGTGRSSNSPGPRRGVPPASPPHTRGETAPRAPPPRPGRLSPYLVDVAEEPVGRVAGEVGQRPEQLPPPVVELDGLQQHAGQAEDGGQVQHPGHIHAQPGELHPTRPSPRRRQGSPAAARLGGTPVSPPGAGTGRIQPMRGGETGREFERLPNHGGACWQGSIPRGLGKTRPGKRARSP